MWLSLLKFAVTQLGLVDDIESWIKELRLEQEGRDQQKAEDTAASVAADAGAARNDDRVSGVGGAALDDELRRSLGNPAA